MATGRCKLEDALPCTPPEHMSACYLGLKVLHAVCCCDANCDEMLLVAVAIAPICTSVQSGLS